jgi:enoyl-CoA hydratase
MSDDKVLVEQRDRVLVMTINRPEARNAIDRSMAVALAAAIDRLDESEGLSVGVLTGTRTVFSAGMDLKGFLRGETPAIPGRGLAGLTETPPRKPIIAAVEGWALAGGFEMTLACDLVVAGESAKFGTPEVKRSLVASAGAALFLPSRLPRPIAMEMLLTGDPMTAPRAAEVGLINYMVPDGTALDKALELAEAIARNGPLALVATKRIARLAADWTTENRWDKQREISAPVQSSDDAREGAAAFVEKRQPVWSNR